ncbi:MAG: hypothetical protein ACLTXI_02915 [Collinsella sp.]
MPAWALPGDDALAVVPAQELLDDARGGHSCGARWRSRRHIPACVHGAQLLDGARDWTATVLDMEDKRIAKLPVRDNGDGTVRVAQHPFEHDALLVVSPAR